MPPKLTNNFSYRKSRKALLDKKEQKRLAKIRVTESTTAKELRKPMIGNISVKESAIIKWPMRKKKKKRGRCNFSKRRETLAEQS